jgi:hypothetical protein
MAQSIQVYRGAVNVGGNGNSATLFTNSGNVSRIIVAQLSMYLDYYGQQQGWSSYMTNVVHYNAGGSYAVIGQMNASSGAANFVPHQSSGDQVGTGQSSYATVAAIVPQSINTQGWPQYSQSRATNSWMTMQFWMCSSDHIKIYNPHYSSVTVGYSFIAITEG